MPNKCARELRMSHDLIREEFQEITEFSPAFDRRDPDPKKNFGIHGVELRMVLKGPEGAVQFVLYTNWQLPHVREEQDKSTIETIAAATRPKRHVIRIEGVAASSDRVAKMLDEIESAVVPYDEGNMQLRCFYHPLAADLGVHSPKPLYPDQLPMGAEKFDFERKETLQGATGNIEIPTRVKTGTFDPCPWLDGKPCYYDGSTLNAEPVFEILLKEGSAGVWRELREYYDRTFPDRRLRSDGNL